jgi:anti-sigma regulatory factor (Ser/Thr protein kinase)/GAF domain-containing protein
MDSPPGNVSLPPAGEKQPGLYHRCRGADRGVPGRADGLMPGSVQGWFDLLDGLGDVVTVFDSGWQCLHVSPRAAQAVGRPADELRGCSVQEVFPQLAGTPQHRAALEAVRTGEPTRTVWFYARDGRWLEQRAIPSRAGTVLVVDDVTDREVARARAERLVAIGQALAGTINYEQVQAVVAGEVFALAGASGGALAVADRDLGVLHWLGSSGVDPLGSDSPDVLPLRVRTPTTDTLNTGAAVWIAGAEEGSARYPQLAERFARIAQAVVSLPLSAGGETVGALTLTFPDLERISGADRDFLSTVAAMCAQALTRARLFDAEKRSIDELQRHLLPRQLPAVAGVDLAVHYASAETGVDIGGDWYDVVALPSGALALVMGDVEGHDLGAAALMGLLRSALRAYTLEEHPPAVALSRANTFLAGLAVERIVTVAVLHLHPEEGLVTAVSAGHPAALVVSPELQVSEVPTENGPPLGVFEHGMHWPETTSPLAPGSVITMFTDGLVEQRGEDISVGIARLRETMSANRNAPVEGFLARLLGARTDAASDDVAILVAKLGVATETARWQLRRRLPSTPVSVTLARRLVRQLLPQWQPGWERAEDIELVVSELVTNAVRASDDVLELRIREHEGRMRVEVSDSSHQQPRMISGEHERADGRGLHLINALANRWGVDSSGLGKTVWCEFELPAEPSTN